MDDLLKQLTPAWLTNLLRSHGHLANGQVTTLCITNTFETPPSTHAQLTVAYSPDAPADAPTRLFLKMPKAHKLARGNFLFPQQPEGRVYIIDYLTVPLQYQSAIQNYPALFKRLFASIMHEFQAWECAELLF